MKLEIIWRNPDPKGHKQRWQKVETGVERSLYGVQELIVKGDKGFWSPSCAFEVQRGGRKPLPNPSCSLPVSAFK